VLLLPDGHNVSNDRANGEARVESNVGDRRLENALQCANPIVCAPAAAEDRQSADSGFELIKGNIHGSIL
jgi:hypothetical protein